VSPLHLRQIVMLFYVNYKMVHSQSLGCHCVNPEKVKITLQEMGDQISYLTVVLEKYVTYTHIGSNFVCSYLRMCGEKSQ
jgi:hypothetical protein